MAAIARIYTQSFDRSPGATLAVTNGALSGLGDIVAQMSQMVIAAWDDDPFTRPDPYDPARTVRFVTFGTFMGPFLARWNAFLERGFPLRTQGGTGRVSLAALAKRVGCDQVVMAPLGLVAFIGSMGFMEGRSRPEIKAKYRDLYSTALVKNWQVWPIAQTVNFRLMPLPYRVPFQATCGVFWTLYLSLLNSSPKVKNDEKWGVRRDEPRPT